jgi:hypothetical protein
MKSLLTQVEVQAVLAELLLLIQYKQCDLEQKQISPIK